jgi:hypothetical protein
VPSSSRRRAPAASRRIAVLRADARRPEQVDRVMLSCFVLGPSVRKVSQALLPILGRPASPATVSTVAKQLDAVVAAFHPRPLKDQCRILMFDGVMLARKTSAGVIRRPVLVALGLRPDCKKEVIDFRLAQSESAAEWERFLGDLIRRGLVGDRLEMICLDGGAGLLAALPTAIRVSRCGAAGRTRSTMSSPRRTSPTSRPSRPTCTRSRMPLPCRGRGRRLAASPTAGWPIIRGPSLACGTTSTNASLAGATNP